MMASQYLWKQLNGEVAQAVIKGIEDSFDAPDSLVSYWSSLSIATALDVDGTLDYVGILSGYPRPLVSNIFFSDFLMVLADAAHPYDDPVLGLADAATPLIGGQLDTALPLSTNIMPAAWYQELLPIMAVAKYYGLSLHIVDVLAAWANTNGGGTGYTITWDQYKNIVVIFTTAIDPRVLWVVNAIVQFLETLPLVVFEEP